MVPAGLAIGELAPTIEKIAEGFCMEFGRIFMFLKGIGTVDEKKKGMVEIYWLFYSIDLF